MAIIPAHKVQHPGAVPASYTSKNRLADTLANPDFVNVHLDSNDKYRPSGALVRSGTQAFEFNIRGDKLMVTDQLTREPRVATAAEAALLRQTLTKHRELVKAAKVGNEAEARGLVKEEAKGWGDKTCFPQERNPNGWNCYSGEATTREVEKRVDEAGLGRETKQALQNIGGFLDRLANF